MIEPWRRTFRDGFAPSLSTPALTALRDALRADSPQLVQGATTTPPPLMCVQDWPVEAACAVAYLGWKGDGLDTVGDVEERFGRYCHEADARLGGSAMCAPFLTWFDDQPRPVVFHELAAEITWILEQREAATDPDEESEEETADMGDPVAVG